MKRKATIFRGAVLGMALLPAIFGGTPPSGAMQMQRLSTVPAPDALIGTWAYAEEACADPSALRLHADGRVESHGLRGFWQLDDERIVVFVRKPAEAGDYALTQRRASYRTEWQLRALEADRMVLSLESGESEFVRC